jgi:hypothetical protein
MKRLTRRSWVLLGVIALVVFGAVGAFAYWTTTGAGSGSATTTTGTAIVVNQTSTSSGLYPGGSVALSGNFDNPATFNQYVTSVTAAITAFSLQADNTKPACTQNDFSLSGNPATVGAQVVPGNGVGTWTGITLNMANTGANQDNCKGVTVPLTYTSN